MTRSTEFAMGLIGGIVGFIASIFALLVGGIGSASGTENAATVVTLGWAAMGFAILGIIGAALVKSRTKLAGRLMLLSAGGGLLSISLFYSLSFVLLLIAGLMALLKRDE